MEKSGKKSGRRGPNRGSFVSGDPRSGRGPAPGAPNAGRPPEEFKAIMRSLASRDDVLRHLESILNDPNHPDYLKAWKEVADRGYGKATLPLDITSDGGPLQIVLRVPEPESDADR